MSRPAASLRQTASPLAGSLLAAALGQGALVVSGVLVFRLLGPRDRGYLGLIVLFPAVLGQLGSLGLPLAATYYLSRQRERSAAIVRLLASAAVAQAAVLLLLHAGILAAVFWSDPHLVRIAALISLPAVPAILAQSYGIAVLQGEQRFAAFNVLRTVPAAAYAAVVLAIYLGGSGNLEWVVVGWICSSVASGLATLVLAVRPLRHAEPAGEPPSLRELLRFGLRGLLGWTSPIETFRLDQAIVGLFLSPAALGYYLAGLAFASLPRFLAQSVGYIAYPRIAARSGDEARSELRQFFWLAAGGAALVVAGLELVVPQLGRFFFGADFGGAVDLTRILLVGALFLAARRILTDGAQGLGRPGLGTVAELASWVFLLPALAIFTPLLGARGVALALTLSAALSFGVLLLLVSGRRAVPRIRPGFLAARGTE
jgi:O-antigen/teichoic acid export membrane protein